MTIRDIVIGFGFEVDKTSEDKVNKAVGSLKTAASDALSSVGVKFEPDKASEQTVMDSVDHIAETAKPLEKTPVGYEVDKASEKNAKNSIKGLKNTATKLLGAIGIGFSLVKVIGMAKKFIATNEDMQAATKQISEEWNNWKKEINDTYGISKKLSQAMLKGFNTIMKVVRRVTDGFIKFANKIGGVQKLLKLIAIAAGAILVALNAGKILSFIKALGNGLGKVNLKMIAIVAIIIILALLIEDLIKFMNGEDSLMGALFEKFGIDGDMVRETIQGILDAVKGLLPFLLDLGKQVGWFLLNTLKELLPFLIDIAKTVIPVIISLIQRLLPLAMRIIKAILPVLITLIEKLIPIVMQIIDTVLPIIISLIEKLLPVVMQIIDAVLPVVISLIETLISVIVPIIDAILPVLMGLLEALMPIITFVADLLGNVLGAAFEALGPIINAIMGVFQGIIDFLVGVFTGDWTKVWDGIVSIFKNIIDGIVAIFKTPINWIIDGINFFIGGLNKLKIPDWVPLVGGKGINIPLIPKLEKGSDFTPDTFIAGDVDGKGGELVTGAKGRKVFTAGETGNIFDTLKSLAKMAVNPPAPTPPEPGTSPSPLGGFSGMIQTLKDIATMGATPKAETVAAASSNVENKNVTQNVEINNKFEGDRAGQQKSAEAMDKAANDVTGVLSRGLAYAR